MIIPSATPAISPIANSSMGTPPFFALAKTFGRPSEQSPCQSAVSFPVVSDRLRNTLDKLVQDPPAQSVADLAERREPLLRGSVDGRGIGEPPVEHAPSTGEQRARFSGLIARRHDDIERSVRDLVDALAALA